MVSNYSTFVFVKIYQSNILAVNKKKTLFTSKLHLNLRKKLVKLCTWSIALYGAET